VTSQYDAGRADARQRIAADHERHQQQRQQTSPSHAQQHDTIKLWNNLPDDLKTLHHYYLLNIN